MLSPDGVRVALWDGDVTRIWDVGEGDQRWVHLGSGDADPLSAALSGMLIPRTTFGISDASFSSDGTLVLTSAGDGSARIWSVETGAELLKLYHGRHVLCGRFSSDGSRILTVCAGGAVRLWDARNGDLIALLANGGGFEPQFAFSPDGFRCATVGGDGIVRSWNSETGTLLAESVSHPDQVSSIAFTLDGKRLVSASASEVLLSDAESGVTRARIDGKLLEISAEHDLIVVGGQTFMQLRNTRDGSLVWALSRGMTHAAISPDGSRLFCWDEEDSDINDFDVLSGAPVGLFGEARQKRGSSRLSFNSDGSRVLIFDQNSSGDLKIALCDSTAGSVIATFERATAVAFSPDGSRFCYRPQREAPTLLDATNGAQIGGALGHSFDFDGEWTGMEFGPDAGRLILFGMDNRSGMFGTGQPLARIFDTQTGNKVSELRGHTSPKVWPVEFDPAGERLLTVDDHTMVRVWEADTGRELLRLDALHHDETDNDKPTKVTQAKYSPDGSLILTKGDDGRVRLWDAVSGGVIATLDAGTTAILAGAEFSPDGKMVLAACGDYSLRLWDVSSGRELAVMEGHDSKIDAYSFSADGQEIVSISGSTLRRWGRAGNTATDSGAATA